MSDMNMTKINVAVQALREVIGKRGKKPYVLQHSWMRRAAQMFAPLLYGIGGILGSAAGVLCLFMLIDGSWNTWEWAVGLLGCAVICWSMEWFGAQSQEVSRRQWEQMASYIKYLVTRHPQLADDIKPLIPLMYDKEVNSFWVNEVTQILETIEILTKEEILQQKTIANLQALCIPSESNEVVITEKQNEALLIEVPEEEPLSPERLTTKI